MKEFMSPDIDIQKMSVVDVITTSDWIETPED